jgi:hypothetical protein
MKQAVATLGYAGVADEGKPDMLKAVLAELSTADMHEPPAYATTFMYRKIKELTGRDPYSEIKRTYNDEAMKFYRALRASVKAAEDPLWNAARLAIAGNIIDFGIYSSVDIEGTVKRAMKPTIEVDDYPAFKAEAERADRILYLMDNAGECVFDMLLIEVLIDMGKDVTAVVKGGPVINDATMDDARQVGLTELCAVVDNGSDAVGTIFSLCRADFKDFFDSFPMIISKGQGNFETLQKVDKNIFFLFQAKCDVIANALGLENGAMLLKRGGANQMVLDKGYGLWYYNRRTNS